MRKIKRTDKILNVHHSDLDGCVCSLIMSHVFKDVSFLGSSFPKINANLSTVNFNYYEHVILTDIYPNDSSLIDNEKIVLLDHHDTAIKFHDPSKSRFIDLGQCAASLVQRFFQSYYQIDLSFLNDIVSVANDYDMWIHKDRRSKMLDMLYWKYRDLNFRYRFADGVVKFTDEEIDYLKQKIREYRNLYASLKGIDFESINGCYVECINKGEFINDICNDLLNEGYKIVFARSDNRHVSIRHRVTGLHIGNILTETNLGGGHANAAGMLKSEDNKVFTDNLMMLEKVLYDRFLEARVNHAGIQR